jgi:hypothetical protein
MQSLPQTLAQNPRNDPMQSLPQTAHTKSEE